MLTSRGGSRAGNSKIQFFEEKTGFLEKSPLQFPIVQISKYWVKLEIWIFAKNSQNWPNPSLLSPLGGLFVLQSLPLTFSVCSACSCPMLSGRALSVQLAKTRCCNAWSLPRLSGMAFIAQKPTRKIFSPESLPEPTSLI